MSARQSAALIALQAALMVAFRADGVLAEAIAGRIHDGTPKAPVPPFLAFTEASASDWSGGDATGCRLRLTLEAVAGDGGRERAVAVLDRAVAVALAASPALAHGALVLLRADTTTIFRARDGRGWTARATLDALIDAIS